MGDIPRDSTTTIKLCKKGEKVSDDIPRDSTTTIKLDKKDENITNERCVTQGGTVSPKLFITFLGLFKKNYSRRT